jgi:Trk K+ transport system NAD-binding subunit
VAHHLVVCGDDPLAHRLAEELVVRYRTQVTVILPNKRRNHGPQIARLPNIRVVEADRLDAEAFHRAELATATAIALVHQDDVGNIHAALQAQEINPRLRLVIRMFNTSLGYGIRRLFTDCRVLSDASMAAPAFVAAALGEVAPAYVRLPGRTLYVARRTDVAAADVVCGLADTSQPGKPDLLPRDQARADLVLAVAKGAPATEPAPKPAAGRDLHPRRPRWSTRALGIVRAAMSRRLGITAMVLFGLLVGGAVAFGVVRHLRWWDAIYEAITIALSGTTPEPGRSATEKITETVLSVVSIALIPVVTAAVVDAVVKARLASELGVRSEPVYSDHVVVIGLGNVGTRVIRQLHELGVPVVAVDKAEAARGAQVAAELGIPLVLGDASREETLRQAQVDRCRAMVALSTDDVTNLEAALHCRTLKPDVRVVLRLFDGDFADRVQKAFNITSSRSVSFVAAPAFVAAMLEREVVAAIPVSRRVLLIAEVRVAAGSALDGAPPSAADDVGESRVIALTPALGSRLVWPPPAEHRLRAGDELLVVATRAGLGRLLNQTADLPAPAANP